MPNDPNPWTVLSSENLYENEFISLIRHRVRDAADAEGEYGVVQYMQLGVRILPIDQEGHTWLVGQHRFAVGAYSWELPAGGGDLGELPEKAAARELQEEVGLQASQWAELNRLTPAGSMLDLREVSYLAWDLSRAEKSPDPQERLQIRRLPFSEAVQMALNGGIANAGAAATILMAHVKALRGDLSREVSRLLR